MNIATTDPSGAAVPGVPDENERVLAQIASALFAALPGQAAAFGAGGGSAPPVNAAGAGPAPIAPPPASLGGADIADLDQALPVYAHAPIGDVPVVLAPPALGGFGRVIAPDHASLPVADQYGSGGGLDPADVPLALPARPSLTGGKGYSAASIENGDRFYFLDAKPAAPAPVTASGFGPLPAAASTPVAAPAGGLYDARRIRDDFPILRERVGGKPLVWLDNGATTQKPHAVIDRLAGFYAHENSNIHRAAHELAARATDAYEGARDTVARFLGAPAPDTIVFTRGTTEAINLVAQTWGRANLRPGDAIVLSQLEHHANIVPWVRLADELGFTIRVAPVDDRGDIIVEEYARLLDGGAKLVAFTQVSNALGTVTPAKVMIELAHAAGAVVLLDGAQSVSHMPVDVAALNPDFLVFSGHKIYGPTGIGALYGRKALLDAMPPWQSGGNMIEDVTFEQIRYHGAPMRFEAGTGNIADAAGLATALDYVLALGREAICAHEHLLLAYAEHQLRAVPGVRLIGEPVQRAGAISFVKDGIDVPAIGSALSGEGIAVRAGHHCAQPILRRMGVEATVRPSFGVYNTLEDVDALVRVLRSL
ncbi:cysteine desulfurase [Sphingomonas sp. 8AM]|uniref:cysteine desulfurase n=1 Tax=Sphingomonas sp. 8AM TaxID=2653170 RepID=UPI0012F1650F|nr:cysteine desulfurase [Sphingomonas sp. 8AM]VXC98946.1 putative cysteine desulfurase [Sphingomonas sp. 8AM]